MSFKPIDGKRDDFRRYLERTGVLDAITKVLIKLLKAPQRPENAVEFIRNNLGATTIQANIVSELTVDLEDARNEIAELKRTVEQLQAKKVQETGPEQTSPRPVQDTAPAALPPTATEPEKPQAVPGATNTEVPAPIEAVPLAEPGGPEQENKQADSEVSAAPQEDGGN